MTLAAQEAPDRPGLGGDPAPGAAYPSDPAPIDRSIETRFHVAGRAFVGGHFTRSKRSAFPGAPKSNSKRFFPAE